MYVHVTPKSFIQFTNLKKLCYYLLLLIFQKLYKSTTYNYLVKKILISNELTHQSLFMFKKKVNTEKVPY